jgi:molybdopterin synthase sulfur carrier subunit
MKLLYFAWLRQKTGHGSEQITLPDDIQNVAGLMDWLAGRGEGYADAFANREAIKIAVNQIYCDVTQSISNADEVAFFPPVTGG